jgi:hypothetical protein
VIQVCYPVDPCVIAAKPSDVVLIRETQTYDAALQSVCG